MSGLDRMKARILEEAEQSAAEILGKAEEEAGAVVRTAREEASAKALEIAERAKRAGEEAEERTEASLDMHRKQAYLAAKQEIIMDVLRTAYEKIMNLDDERYFGLLEKMLRKYAAAREGVIYFSKKDLRRMPEEFERKIKAAAADRGGSLTLSCDPADIDGGFILVYGGIEENCTIKAVFDSKKDELSDQINRLLFG